MERSSQEPLDLEFPLSDAASFIPVNLGSDDLAVSQAHLGDALALAPARPALELAQPCDFSDPRARCDRFNRPDLAQNLEVHRICFQTLGRGSNARRNAAKTGVVDFT
jgi:hypothetical protein